MAKPLARTKTASRPGSGKSRPGTALKREVDLTAKAKRKRRISEHNAEEPFPDRDEHVEKNDRGAARTH